MDAPDAVVIGGGFFGCCVALELAQRALEVVLLESEPELLTRASAVNQARVHNGYHYPRSILTALRSRANFERFGQEFAGAVRREGRMLYGVATSGSNVTAEQFQTFCARIGAPFRRLANGEGRVFDPRRVEAVFEVEEHTFDARVLRGQMQARLHDAGVDVRLGARAERLVFAGAEIVVEAERGALFPTRRVVNCTYANLNFCLARSGRPVVPLKHELTEVALVRAPTALSGTGLTLMCGPFFSMLPFPMEAGLHSLTHVRYTPQAGFRDAELPAPALPRKADDFVHTTRFAFMQRDAERYAPVLAELEHVRSLFELKTTLPAHELDDGRPILFHADPEHPRLVSILGGKIDNVYDLPRELDRWMKETS